jgi:tetratricopeptide (TPR) repeat protein
MTSSLLLATTEEDLISLLKKQQKDPKNGDLMLEVSKAYNDLGIKNLSLKWTQKRIDLGGSSQDVLTSYLSLAKSYEENNENDKAETIYTEALKAFPKSADPLYHLAKLARQKGNNELCTFYALQGKKISPNELTSKNVASYLLDEELSIAAYYTNEKEEGFLAINRLLLNQETPEFIKKQALKNLHYYIKPIENTLSIK